MKILIQELDSAHSQMIIHDDVTGKRSRIYRIINKDEKFYLLEDLMKCFNINRLELLEYLKS